MASKQSKHIIPVATTSPVLVSNGIEKIVPYHLSSDFTVVAKDDGIVKDVNKELGLVVLEYKNMQKGKDVQIINTAPKICKNGAGGFYLSNRLICNMKKGDKLKRNDVLAYNDKFFSKNRNGVSFNIGTFLKVACMSSYATYEDATFVTDMASDKMTAEIAIEKTVALGKNANVDFIVKKGQAIQVNDVLITFDQSSSDSSMNKLLANIGEDLKEEIAGLGKTPVKSKYTGVVEDIKIFCTVELEELSPSLKKIVKSYYDEVNKKKNFVKKYRNNELSLNDYIFTEISSKIETKDGKVKGVVVNEGVMIEFYIKYRDPVGIGDKLVCLNAHL